MNDESRSALDAVRKGVVAALDAMTGALGSLRSDMNAGFARVDTEIGGLKVETASLRSEMNAGFARVDSEMRTGFARVDSEMRAGFARGDRFMELQQAQHLELRDEVQEMKAMLLALTERVDGLEVRLTSLESTVQRLDSELRSVRDWATREFAEIRSELRQVRETVEKDASLRRDVRALETRVDHLERRLPQ